MQIPLVFNPGSGTGPKEPASILAKLDLRVRERLLPMRMTLPFDYSEAIDLAQRAGAPLLVWGGDGTVHHAAKALLQKGCPVPLAAIPGGSGNGLTGGLRTPCNAVGAIDNLLFGRELRMDVGRIDGEPFFNVAGCGFEGDIAHAFDEMGGRRGFFNYAKLVLNHWRSTVPTDVKWDAESVSMPTDETGIDKLRMAWRGRSAEFPKMFWSLCFANLPQYGSGLWIAPGADPTDGALQWVSLSRPNVFDMVSEMPQLFREHGRTKLRREGRITSATVQLGKPVKWHLDGEPVSSRDRAEISVEPKTFRMMVIRGCPWV